MSFPGSSCLSFWVSSAKRPSILTLSAMARSFALMTVAYAFHKSATPVAPDTIRCLVVVGLCRAYGYWRRQGYVPYDPSGDWAFVLIEGSGILGALYAAFASRKERFSPPPGDFLIITSGAFLMGMAFHADLNKDVVSDTLWAVAAYLEVLALIPALVAARAGQPQSLDFVRAITLCRVFSLAFWSQAFAELKARSGSSFVGVVVLAVETAAVVLAVELLAAASPKGGRKKEH